MHILSSTVYVRRIKTMDMTTTHVTLYPLYDSKNCNILGLFLHNVTGKVSKALKPLIALSNVTLVGDLKPKKIKPSFYPRSPPIGLWDSICLGV